MTEVLSSRTISVGESGAHIYNTPEAKATKEIVLQFIQLKLQVPVKCQYIRAEVELLVKLSKTIEVKNEFLISNMLNRLNLNTGCCQYAIADVADEVFRTGCNWGRIVVLFTFAAKLAEFCERNKMENVAEKVSGWLFAALVKRIAWIKEHQGWNGFLEMFRDVAADNEKSWFQGLFAATMGLGALAAILYMKV